MQKHGPTIKVLVLGVGPPTTGGIPIFIKLLMDYAKGDNSLFFNHLNISPPHRKRIFRRLLHSLKITFILLAHLLKGYDLVYILCSGIHSFFEKSFFVLLCRIMGVTTLLHMRAGDLPIIYERSSRYMKKTIAWLLEQPDFLLALSTGWASFFERISGHPRIRVVENGVKIPQELPKRDFSRNSTDVLFLGHISEIKGLLVILEAIKQINDLDSSVFFHLVGGEDDEGDFDRIKKIFEQRHITKYRFYGHKSGSEKIEFLKNADIFILPSLYEGFPNALLEAMSYGLPIVATTVGAISEVIDDEKNGYLVEPGDSKALAQAILDLSKDVEKRSAMGKNNYRKVKERFDFKETFGKLKAIFLEAYEF